MTVFNAARDAIIDRLALYKVSGNPPPARLLQRRHGHSPIDRVDSPDSEALVLPCQPLSVDADGNLVDPLGRRRVLRGINLDSAMKLPVRPFMPSYEGDSLTLDNVWFDGEHVLFVGRPFPLEEAALHFKRIKLWGYNTIRYIVVWEAIEHAGPGIYDDEFVNYTIEILKVIHRVGGLYVFLDPHQDVWSRYSGGSGAPLWTLHAAGLQPTRFGATEAAILHNDARFEAAPYDPDLYPKMLWTLNYKRLASLTMFTLFFAGEIYFPHLKINGVNIQKFLQDSHFAALRHLWAAVCKALPDMLDDGTLVGFESMNEPNCGLVGHDDLYYLPLGQQLRIDTTPTVYESFRLGMGLPVEVDVYKITLTGPQKSETRLVDPRGLRAWLLPDEAAQIDAKHGWKRTGWTIGECIFAGVKIWKWDADVDWQKLNQLSQDVRRTFLTSLCLLLAPQHFNQVDPRLSFDTVDETLPSRVDSEFFANYFFVLYYQAFKEMVRLVAPSVFVLMQPPVLEIPPLLVNDPRNIVDDKTIYCPHYYDGMSLMFKSWNYKFNVDTLGIMRGRYFNPILGIVFGERAIRNCIRKQFEEIAAEGRRNLGNIPVLMSETGMPFDMNHKKAYEDGQYQQQTSAIDALAYALEGLQMHHTYWCYTSISSHKWGDRWNNEDFSFWSPEDRDLAFDDASSFNSDSPKSPSRRSSVTPSLRTVKEHSSTQMLKTRLNYHKKKLLPALFKKSFLSEFIECGYDSDDNSFSGVESSSLISVSQDNLRFRHYKNCYPSPDGVRAVSAVIRPALVATTGLVKLSEFNLRTVKYTLTLEFGSAEKTVETPTIIFVPSWHFPYLNYLDIYLTSGTVKYNEQLEYLEWYHEHSLDLSTSSEHTIVIRNHSGKLEDLDSDEESCPIA